MQPLSVYIHIPFCLSKCAYCDFASFPGQEAHWEAYFRALNAEIRAAGDARYRVETVFFGGGTPSLVPAELLADTLATVREAFCLSPAAEISLEANPGTIHLQKLRAYRRAGFNRISLGVQSFDARLLREIGRIHTPEQAAEAVRLAREAGFENLNLDLMYGLPGQSVEDFRATLSRAIALQPEHVSAYALIVEEGTPIARRTDELPPEEEVLEMQRLATRMLAASGLVRYEISNYARPGFACRHNRVYWHRGEYRGFGAAAHSFLGGARFENPSELSRYLSGERGLNREEISPESAMEEAILLATRTVEGLSLSRWRSEFGSEFSQGREQILKDLLSQELIAIDGDALRLTPRGMELQNAIVLALVDG
ncbi:MAG TPA: radical SAM family heme chaperone HemW [Candidatus Pullichristensenella excrementigallinarum]|uniref:Heme chaperone HemW n=1 Tax=Candidatus Pullichristensenella excrementigallinarum TaxID=2840907 RepID=A0A9D1LAM3_9FIRM|nr:radical SAM family heme chaperone HemW [Candidatus Pullichristensenella excrementigallinarum]